MQSGRGLGATKFFSCWPKLNYSEIRKQKDEIDKRSERKAIKMIYNYKLVRNDKEIVKISLETD